MIEWPDDGRKRWVLQSDCHVSCLEKTSHCLLSGQYIHAVKHGSGNTMLWERFSAVGTGRLVKMEGKINTSMYRDILVENLLQRALDLRLGWWFIFQQDNDPNPDQASLQAAGRSIRSFYPIRSVLRLFISWQQVAKIIWSLLHPRRVDRNRQQHSVWRGQIEGQGWFQPDYVGDAAHFITGCWHKYPLWMKTTTKHRCD